MKKFKIVMVTVSTVMAKEIITTSMGQAQQLFFVDTKRPNHFKMSIKDISKSKLTTLQAN
jgi:hypothetical protein